jgi:hypothetical protein
VFFFCFFFYFFFFFGMHSDPCRPLLDYICLDYLILNALDIDDLFAVWKVAIV